MLEKQDQERLGQGTEDCGHGLEFRPPRKTTVGTLGLALGSRDADTLGGEVSRNRSQGDRRNTEAPLPEPNSFWAHMPEMPPSEASFDLSNDLETGGGQERGKAMSLLRALTLSWRGGNFVSPWLAYGGQWLVKH